MPRRKRSQNVHTVSCLVHEGGMQGMCTCWLDLEPKEATDAR